MTVDIAEASNPPCAAEGRGCGTPTGWRNKGRCPDCRRAHNEETKNRRRAKSAPSPQRVTDMIARIREGADLTVAARHAGVNPRTARVLAETDPRVAEALAIVGSAVIDRRVAYLTALLAVHGERQAATRRAGVASSSTIAYWRSDELFRAAEDALCAYAQNHLPNPGRRPVTDERLARFLTLAGEGLSVEDAAERCGFSADTVYYRARKDPEFAKRLSAARKEAERTRQPLTPAETRQREDFLAEVARGALLKDAARRAGLTYGQLEWLEESDPTFSRRLRELRPKGTRVVRKQIDEERLRQLWASDLSTAEIAKILGVHFQTVCGRAKQWSLGPRLRHARGAERESTT